MLAPIQDDPAQSRLSIAMRGALEAVAARWPVAIVTGRDRVTLARLGGLPETLTVAASHGFELWSPRRGELPGPPVDRQLLASQFSGVEEQARRIDGVRLERKPFSLALHVRGAPPAAAAAVRELVDRVLEDAGGSLRVTPGRQVWELQPAVDWNKGRAVDRLLADLPAGTFPVYLGDDITDEDGFRAVAGRGAGILVLSDERGDRPTAAALALDGVPAVERFLRMLAQY